MIDEIGYQTEDVSIRNEICLPGVVRTYSIKELWHEYQTINNNSLLKFESQLNYYFHTYPNSVFEIRAKGKYQLYVLGDMKLSDALDEISLERFLTDTDTFSLALINAGERIKEEQLFISNLTKRKFKQLQCEDIMKEWAELNNIL